MRIGIDYHTAFGKPQGIRTYITNLVLKLIEIDRNNEYFLYSPKNSKECSPFAPNVRFRNVLSSNPFLRLGFELPYFLRQDSVDIFHSNYICPIQKRCGYAVTVHDILFEHYPELFEATFVLRSKIFLRHSVKQADTIITVSQYSKNAIYSTYGIEQSRIVVTPEGVDETFLSKTDDNQFPIICQKYGIKVPYLLYVGRLEPRKNIPMLIKAFSQLQKERFQELSLVIGGAKDFGYDRIFKTVKAQKIENKVSFIGKISQNDLPAILSGAKIFVYPTFYEGFGLPVLEAMACGTPVVTSNTSSLPEIVGDAGILVNPFDIDSIVSGIHTLLSDNVLYNELRRRGIQRARMFSWQQCAEKTLQVYTQLRR
jgi:glycosyltransferase involved in cell wall biosynthesis